MNAATERVRAADVRSGDTIRVDVLSEWRVCIGRKQRGYSEIDLYFDDGPDDVWRLAFKRSEMVERALTDGHGVSLIPVIEDRIEWWDDPDVDKPGTTGFNARWFRHVGCEDSAAPWMVPQDGLSAPTRDTDECPRCCQVRPLVAAPASDDERSGNDER